MDKHKALIEKVARMLADDLKELGFNADSLITDSEGNLDPLWTSFVPQATAALHAVYEALKEPSEEMVKSAREHHEGEAYLPYSLWQAMLSASALSSPLGEGETIPVDNGEKP